VNRSGQGKRGGGSAYGHKKVTCAPCLRRPRNSKLGGGAGVLGSTKKLLWYRQKKEKLPEVKKMSALGDHLPPEKKKEGKKTKRKGTTRGYPGKTPKPKQLAGMRGSALGTGGVGGSKLPGKEGKGTGPTRIFHCRAI